MANWKAKIDVKDLHDAFNENGLSMAVVAGEVAKRLRKTPYAEDLWMLDIIEQLESIAADGDQASVEDYDAVLAELYNFGDDDHQLWINTL
jgi:hypothetical protein